MLIFSYIDIKPALDKVRQSGDFKYEIAEYHPFIKELIKQLEDFQTSIKDSIKEIVKFLFPKMEGHYFEHFNTFFPYIFWTLIVIISVLLLYFLYRLLNQYRKIEKVQTQAIVNISNGKIDYTSWIDLSKEHYKDLKYRDACRAVYMAVIFYLDEQEIIKYDKAKTNMEYLQNVKNQNCSYNEIKQIINKFEYLWYGKHPGSNKDYDFCFELYKKVVNE